MNNYMCNNFNGISTNSQYNKNIYSLNDSYKQNNELIGKTDFKNYGHIIHNNIADNIFLERITEYQINIDSNDRKILVYPSPFKFVVSFGGSGGQVINNKHGKNNDDYFEGTPGPIIDRKFKNVKYVKLDYIMLPRFCKLSHHNDKYEIENLEGNNFSNYGYLILKINELSSGRILGTNTLISDDSFIIYPDKIMGPDFMMWSTSNGSRIFNNSSLGNIDKLTISILTPTGQQLYFYDSMGNSIQFDKIYKNCSSTSPIFNKLKCYASILIGVVENEINTNTKYEN